MDYGDFRGLILRVAPGTLVDYVSPQDDPFGLLALRGDFDCRDQRRLPYCHPDLLGDDWFSMPISLQEVEFVTVHQPGDSATVMNFTENFGNILAMAGFIPTAEFYQGTTQLQVRGAYNGSSGGGTPAPTATLTANPTSLASGSSSTLSWISTHATSCTASGGWNGGKQTSGSEAVTPTATTTYTLSCTGDGGTAQSSVTVTVTVSSESTFSGSSTNQGSTWSAIVTVSGGPGNTLISGGWNIGGTPNSCTTNSSGACTITRSGIPKRTASVTWTYTATGQTVTISKP
jgi:hypothetical protein